jgi:hypothetical protein
MACDADINFIRGLHPLKQILDEEICAYFDMALDELVDYDIIPGKENKARSYMTLKLIGQLLWHRVQERVNEYDETLETFRDVSKWMDYWQARLQTLVHVEDDTIGDDDVEEITTVKVGSNMFGVI